MPDKKTIARACRHFVLDMDGTFYLGNRILEGSLDFLKKVEQTGRDYIFFTNNSSKSPEVYIEKLAKMGCYITRNQIITSGDVTIEFLKKNYTDKRVYLVGTQPLVKSFLDNGVNLVKEDPEIVVIGFDTSLTYEKLVKACDFIRGGALFLATHLDINCPVEGGYIPDVGSFCALISLSTGGKKPKALGKPYKETVDMIMRRTGWTDRSQVAFVGDRIYTDVATGLNNGAKGLLVLCGESDMETVRQSKAVPDGIYQDLKEIGSYLD